MAQGPQAGSRPVMRNLMLNRSLATGQAQSVIHSLFNREYGLPYYTKGAESLS